MPDIRTKINSQGSSVKDIIADLDTGPGRILYKGVIAELINDPSVFKNEFKDSVWNVPDPESDNPPEPGGRGFSPVRNPSYASSAPRNSAIVRIVSDGMDKQSDPLIAYPFFPPYLAMPIKPGETVWLIGENTSEIGNLPYWICRVPENINVDNINYTHSDRKLTIIEGLTTSEKMGNPEKEEGEEPKGNILPEFPNGDDTQKGSSLRFVVNPVGKPLPDVNSYNDLVEHSTAFKIFTPEPIPRFTKRPGDLVLQGSNNALICLGKDRGWKPTEDPGASPKSNAQEVVSEQSGAIDLVAGRGRYFPAKPTNKNQKGDPAEKTSVITIENTRKEIESNINPAANNIKPNLPVEGDPDLVTDAARVYISMKTAGDLNFGISQTVEKNSMATGIEAPIIDISDSAYVVAKGDEIRVIARKAAAGRDAIGSPEINGSVRIVKEGIKDEDLATIVLLPDGTIQISGSKIFLGRSTEDGGAGGGPGPGEMQPYVKYQELENIWNSLMDQISTFCDTVLTHTTPGYGAPSPQLNAAANALKTVIANPLKPDIAKVKSERIFGE